MLLSSSVMSLIAFCIICFRSFLFSSECRERISCATKLPKMAYSSSFWSVSQLQQEVTVSCVSLSLVSVVLWCLFLDGVPWILFPLALRFLGVCVISLLWSSLSLGWNETCYHSESVLTLKLPNAKNLTFIKLYFLFWKNIHVWTKMA
jgi:hypothetical protein